MLRPALAHADPLPDGRALFADPDQPGMGLAFRAHLRAMVGAEIPVVGEPAETGLFLRLPAAVELHNLVNNATPNNYWRGLFGIALGYRWCAGQGWRSSALALEVQHESDHETVDLVRYFHGDTRAPDAPVGFLQFNAVGLAVSTPWQFAKGQQFLTRLRTRFHILSCNLAVERCASGQGGYGSSAFEARLDAAWMGGLAGEADGRWRPFAALHLEWLPPHALVGEERRAVMNAGGWVRTLRRGLFEFFLTGWAGNDVGYLRSQSALQLGAGFRWSPSSF